MAIGDGHAAKMRGPLAITLETIRDAESGGKIDRTTFARIIAEMYS